MLSPLLGFYLAWHKWTKGCHFFCPTTFLLACGRKRKFATTAIFPFHTWLTTLYISHGSLHSAAASNGPEVPEIRHFAVSALLEAIKFSAKTIRALLILLKQTLWWQTHEMQTAARKALLVDFCGAAHVIIQYIYM